MDPKAFEHLLRHTLEDDQLTGSERKSLREYVSNAGLNDQHRAQLRSLAFKLAREVIVTQDAVRVIGWLEEVNKVLLPPGAESSNVYMTASFSPGETCVNTITGQIQSARSTVDICVFTITDNRITAAIREAHRRGIQVRVITDNEKMLDEGSDIETLASDGVPIRLDVSDYHMHHKFALFDKRTVLTGSYNWTRGAAVYNEENLVVTNEPKVVRQFSEVFEALWKRLA